MSDDRTSKQDFVLFSMGGGELVMRAEDGEDIVRVTIQYGREPHSWYYLNRSEAAQFRDFLSRWLSVEPTTAPASNELVAEFSRIANDRSFTKHSIDAVRWANTEIYRLERAIRESHKPGCLFVHSVLERREQAVACTCATDEPKAPLNTAKHALRLLMSVPAVRQVLNPSGKPHLGNCGCPWCAAQSVLDGAPVPPAVALTFDEWQRKHGPSSAAYDIEMQRAGWDGAMEASRGSEGL